MIPAEVSEKTAELLTSYSGKKTDILHSTSISGGCINHAMKLETTSGIFFLKWNDAKRYPKMFVAEAKGLSRLKSVNAIGVPEVIATDEMEENSFIIHILILQEEIYCHTSV